MARVKIASSAASQNVLSTLFIVRRRRRHLRGGLGPAIRDCVREHCPFDAAAHDGLPSGMGSRRISVRGVVGSPSHPGTVGRIEDHRPRPTGKRRTRAAGVSSAPEPGRRLVVHRFLLAHLEWLVQPLALLLPHTWRHRRGPAFPKRAVDGRLADSRDSTPGPAKSSGQNASDCAPLRGRFRGRGCGDLRDGLHLGKDDRAPRRRIAGGSPPRRRWIRRASAGGVRRGGCGPSANG